MLDLDNVSFSYGSKKILKNIRIKIAKGEIVSLIGASGSGKTTIFRLITGLLKQQSGSITINEKVLPEGAQEVTYMRQEDLLLPWRTVMENLELINELGSKNREGFTREEAKNLLVQFGLAGCEHSFPHQLSGGMRQRVCLARAFLQNRPLFLLDEPFGSLDVIIREELYQLLKKMRDQHNKTILLVTHDFRDAMALSDRILILSQGTISEEFDLKNGHYSMDNLTTQIRSALLKSFQCA